MDRGRNRPRRSRGLAAEENSGVSIPTVRDLAREGTRAAPCWTRPDARFDVVIGDAFTDVVCRSTSSRKRISNERVVAARLTPEGSFLMTVIDYEDRLARSGSIVLTLREVSPVVRGLDPRGAARTRRAAWSLPWSRGKSAPRSTKFAPPLPPDLMTFAALGDSFVQGLAEEARG